MSGSPWPSTKHAVCCAARVSLMIALVTASSVGLVTVVDASPYWTRTVLYWLILYCYASSGLRSGSIISKPTLLEAYR